MKRDGRLGVLRLLLTATLFGSASSFLDGCAGRSAATDRPLAWTAERLWSAGGADDRRMSLSDLYPFQVAVDGSGRIDVLGWKERRVYRWSATGALLDSMGRQGSGPGEFEEPLALSVDPSGELAVVDLGLRRIARWSARGDLLPPIPITWRADHPRMVFEHGRLWYQTVESAAPGRSEIRLVYVDPAGAHVEAAVPREPRRVVDFPACGGREISVQPFFAPTLQWAYAGDLIAAARGNGYEVGVWKNGVQVTSITRPLPPIPATRELALQAAEGYRFNGCLVAAAEAVASIGYLPVVPLIEEVAVSGDGEVWVRRRAPDGGSRIDLFASAGRYEGTLPATFPFPAAFLPDGQIVVVEKDPSDVPAITVYRVVRTGG